MKIHARFLIYIKKKKAPNLSILKILKHFKGAGKAIITDIVFLLPTGGLCYISTG